MMKNYKGIKIEIKPTGEQIEKINKTIGTGRFLYNFYIAYNKEIYEKEKRFVTGFEFSKYINNVFIKENPDKSWIKDVSSKSNKQAIMSSEKAFKRFFNKISSFPKFKKKSHNNQKCYFFKNNKTDFEFYRHKIKIPTLKFVRLKEYGYIPKNTNIKSATISKEGDRYFLSLILEIKKEIEKNSIQKNLQTKEGIGIDLGIKDFAICSDGQVFKNINKIFKVRKIEKKLKREQRKKSRKYLSCKKMEKNLYECKNFQKQKLVIAKLFFRLNCIRNDYINKVINMLTKTKLKYITIEDLKVSNMIKNKHLSKAISQQKFYEFRTKLLNKCKENNIELRIVSTFYPSSKLCSNCGNKKQDFKLKDRIYKCSCCGIEINRDYNASLNLRNSIEYTILQ